MTEGYRPTTQTLREQLERFNAERAILLGKPLAPGERIPLPFSGVGGDVGPPESEA